LLNRLTAGSSAADGRENEPSVSSLPGYRSGQKPRNVPGDDPFLIRGYDPHLKTSKMQKALADPFANHGRVLADPSREDKCVEPAQRCRQRAHGLAGLVANISTASLAAGSEDARRAFISEVSPDTPSSPLSRSTSFSISARSSARGNIGRHDDGADARRRIHEAHAFSGDLDPGSLLFRDRWAYVAGNAVWRRKLPEEPVHTLRVARQVGTVSQMGTKGRMVIAHLGNGASMCAGCCLD
jgi:hypothetical protein